MMNTNPFKDQDPQKRVVDFEKLRQKRKRKHASHRRIIAIIIAAAVAVAAVVAAVIWTQVNEVTGDQDFWHNFNAGAAVIARRI